MPYAHVAAGHGSSNVPWEWRARWARPQMTPLEELALRARFRYLLLPIVIVLLPRTADAQAAGTGTAADRAAVRAAVLDYVDGFYEGDSTKHVRSVAQDVYKYGYSKRGEAYSGSQMTWAGFM